MVTDLIVAFVTVLLLIGGMAAASIWHTSRKPPPAPAFRVVCTACPRDKWVDGPAAPEAIEKLHADGWLFIPSSLVGDHWHCPSCVNKSIDRLVAIIRETS